MPVVAGRLFANSVEKYYQPLILSAPRITVKRSQYSDTMSNFGRKRKFK